MWPWPAAAQPEPMQPYGEVDVLLSPLLVPCVEAVDAVEVVAEKTEQEPVTLCVRDELRQPLPPRPPPVARRERGERLDMRPLT